MSFAAKSIMRHNLGMTHDITKEPQISIAVKNLKKAYRTRMVLNGISTDIQRAKITAVLGKNGAGKTTFIKCCLGLVSAERGLIAVSGHEPGTKVARQSIGAMLQDVDLPDLLTGAELISLFQSYYPAPLAYDDIISKTQIGDFVNKRYKALSGGQKRRIQFALAIAGDPDILFLDEPTTGLDPKARAALWDIIRHFAQEGKTIILTTHYLEEADILADQIIILEDGRIVEDLEAAALKSRLGGDVIECLTALPLADISRMSAYLSAERRGAQTVIRSSNAALLLRDLLRVDSELSELTVRRPNLETIFSEGGL